MKQILYRIEPWPMHCWQEVTILNLKRALFEKASCFQFALVNSFLYGASLLKGVAEFSYSLSNPLISQHQHE